MRFGARKRVGKLGKARHPQAANGSSVLGARAAASEPYWPSAAPPIAFDAAARRRKRRVRAPRWTAEAECWRRMHRHRFGLRQSSRGFPTQRFIPRNRVPEWRVNRVSHSVRAGGVVPSWTESPQHCGLHFFLALARLGWALGAQIHTARKIKAESVEVDIRHPPHPGIDVKAR